MRIQLQCNGIYVHAQRTRQGHLFDAIQTDCRRQVGYQVQREGLLVDGQRSLLHLDVDERGLQMRLQQKGDLGDDHFRLNLVEGQQEGRLGNENADGSE